MDILRGSLIYRGIMNTGSVLMQGYQHSMLNVMISHFKTANKNSFIMTWLLSRNAEKGVLQNSYFFKLLQYCIKAMSKLTAVLGKPFRKSVDNSGITAFLNTTTKSISNTPLALVGLLGFVFMLSNLIVSVIISRGFTYPGTLFRTALLLAFLLLARVNVEGKSLLNSSFIFRFIKYMID